LDYAFNNEIFISDNTVYSASITWNGFEHEDNYGNNFGDILPGNIQVVMGIFNDDNGYVDETVRAYINTPPDAPDINGPISGEAEKEYEFSFVSEDPGSNSLLYYIKWGDDTVDEWFGPFESGEKVNVSHNWSTKGRFVIKARAKTINGLMGSWGEFKVLIPRYKISINFLFQWFLEKFPFLSRILF
jgi:hypothetical protein